MIVFSLSWGGGKAPSLCPLPTCFTLWCPELNWVGFCGFGDVEERGMPCGEDTAAVPVPAGGRERVALGEVPAITPLPAAVLPFWEASITTAGSLAGVLGAFFQVVPWACARGQRGGVGAAPGPAVLGTEVAQGLAMASQPDLGVSPRPFALLLSPRSPGLAPGRDCAMGRGLWGPSAHIGQALERCT